MRFVALLLLFLVPVAVFAQDDRIDQLQREIEKLKAEIAAMKEEGTGDDKITELERRLEVIAAEIERLKIGEAASIVGSVGEGQHGLGPAASKIYSRAEQGLSIGGYGELLYQSFASERDDNAASGRTDTFDMLRAVLYFGYKFNDRWVLNTEIEYEHANEVFVEFAYIDYLWRPQASFRGGLLLLPMGFLNELHEPTTFLGTTRPAIEQVIIPTTWRENGFGLFGEAGPFSYRTYVVNGLRGAGFTAGSLRGGRQRGSQARAEDFGWVGRLDFNGVPGLLVGASAYTGGSGQDLSAGVDTQILEGHLEWKWRGLELRAMGVQAELDDVADLNRILGFTGSQSVGESLKGHYLQLGYDVLAALFPNTGGEQAFIPYARWETYNTQDEVPRGFSANPANDVEVLTLGLSYKPIDQIVIKADHQDFDNEAGTGIDQFNVLLGWIF